MQNQFLLRKWLTSWSAAVDPVHPPAWGLFAARDWLKHDDSKMRLTHDPCSQTHMPMWNKSNYLLRSLPMNIYKTNIILMGGYIVICQHTFKRISKACYGSSCRFGFFQRPDHPVTFNIVQRFDSINSTWLILCCWNTKIFLVFPQAFNRYTQQCEPLTGMQDLYRLRF